jgi:hypothetical protein
MRFNLEFETEEAMGEGVLATSSVGTELSRHKTTPGARE